MRSDKVKKETKPPGRKRRIAGWTLLTLGVLVAATWVASVWTAIRFSSGRTDLGAHRGIFLLRVVPVERAAPLHPAGVIDEGLLVDMPINGPIIPAARDRKGFWYNAAWRMAEGEPHELHLRLRKGSMMVQLDAYPGTVTAPGWPVPLLLGLSAALLLRSGVVARRRAITGKCESCGYDLAGLGSDAKCPECGKGKTTA